MNKKIRSGGIYSLCTKYGEPMLYGNIETGKIMNTSCNQTMEIRSMSGNIHLAHM
jgi:hypothetical protein